MTSKGGRVEAILTSHLSSCAAAAAATHNAFDCPPSPVLFASLGGGEWDRGEGCFTYFPNFPSSFLQNCVVEKKVQ